ncbi:MAG: CDP-diacylglycerol--glycerol-3-phosphate 3-phosphatidyltransferase [Candidatus Izimaplasma bacterium HR2]|nr:MAG: CDP-diacylglycerol--glycerol-3-phosphate 3-phosphatidyltransferase [Candidatus Izimaplasma bacterium HR2]
MNLPNKISMIRIFIIPIMVIAYYLVPDTIPIGYHVNLLWYIVPGLFVIASITDFIDGYVARKYDLVTTFGKFIDPLADKLLVMTALLLLTVEGIIPVWIVITILSREFIVTGIRLVAAPTGKVIAASKLGKYKTATTMVALVILLMFKFDEAFEFYGMILLYIGLVLTVVSGIEYFWKNRHIIAESI